MAWFWKRRPKAAEPENAPVPPSLADFMAEARREIDHQTGEDPDWYRNLPYRGNLSPHEAWEFEVEKRALWRRVIADAKRSELKGLRWTTRGDAKVCLQCAQLEGRLFAAAELDELDAHPVHLGCRCELVPEH